MGDLPIPGGEVVQLELAQVIVAAGLGQNLHQFDRRCQVVRQIDIGGTVDDQACA